MGISGEEKEWTPPTLEGILARSKDLFTLSLDDRLRLTDKVLGEVELLLAIEIHRVTILTKAEYEAELKIRELEEEVKRRDLEEVNPSDY